VGLLQIDAGGPANRNLAIRHGLQRQQPEGHEMENALIQRRRFLAMSSALAAGLGGVSSRDSARAADGPRLTMGAIRRVEKDGARFFEPWIAANPRDASNLVIVGSRDLGEATTPNRFHMEPAAWFTFDGGSSWSPGELPGTAELPRNSAFLVDACATYASDGTAFCVFLGGPEENRHDLWIYRSDDGGRR
jgi:hypothetical protein